MSFILALLLWSLIPANCFQTAHSTSHIEPRIFVRTSPPNLRAFSLSPEDSAESAELLPFSDDDLNRLSELRSRQFTIPIMFIDAMVPRQSLTFQSADPKFRRLMEACLDDGYSELGILGLSPMTRRPLCHGVTAPISDQWIKNDPSSGTIQLTLKADRRLEIQGEPWLDETNSFYIANIEILDEREEILTEVQLEEAKKLARTLPSLVKEWKEQVILSGRTDEVGLEARVRSIGDMPSQHDPTDLALWISALINPLPALGVSLEIRPAMLSCTNDYERMLLACEAIQGSIDHMTGKKKLF